MESRADSVESRADGRMRAIVKPDYHWCYRRHDLRNHTSFEAYYVKCDIREGPCLTDDGYLLAERSNKPQKKKNMQCMSVLLTSQGICSSL